MTIKRILLYENFLEITLSDKCFTQLHISFSSNIYITALYYKCKYAVFIVQHFKGQSRNGLKRAKLPTNEFLEVGDMLIIFACILIAFEISTHTLGSDSLG